MVWRIRAMVEAGRPTTWDLFVDGLWLCGFETWHHANAMRRAMFPHPGLDRSVSLCSDRGTSTQERA